MQMQMDEFGHRAQGDLFGCESGCRHFTDECRGRNCQLIHNGGKTSDCALTSLLTLTRFRQPELDSAILVGPDRGWHVEYCKRDFLDALRREYPQDLVNNRVVLNVALTLVAKNQDRCGLCL